MIKKSVGKKNSTSRGKIIRNIIVILILFLLIILTERFYSNTNQKIVGLVSGIPPMVERSFSTSSPKPGSILYVFLDVTPLGQETFYALEEHVPNGWDILTFDGETYNNSGVEEGSLKIVVVQGVIPDPSTQIEQKNYNYSVQVPLYASGLQSFSGLYQFDGMSTSASIEGISDITIQGESSGGYSGGGSGGGGILNRIIQRIFGNGECKPEWICNSWGDCQNNKRTRTCFDVNSCDTSKDKPGLSFVLEEQLCKDTCYDDVINQDEIGIDCGGSCSSCEKAGEYDIQIETNKLKGEILDRGSFNIVIENKGPEIIKNIRIEIPKLLFKKNLGELKPGNKFSGNIHVDLPIDMKSEDIDLKIYLDKRLNQITKLQTDISVPKFTASIILSENETLLKKILLFVDNRNQPERTGVQAEISIINKRNETLFSELTPLFKIDENKIFTKTQTINTFGLNYSDELQLKVILYEKGEKVQEKVKLLSLAETDLIPQQLFKISKTTIFIFLGIILIVTLLIYFIIHKWLSKRGWKKEVVE